MSKGDTNLLNLCIAGSKTKSSKSFLLDCIVTVAPSGGNTPIDDLPLVSIYTPPMLAVSVFNCINSLDTGLVNVLWFQKNSLCINLPVSAGDPSTNCLIISDGAKGHFGVISKDAVPVGVIVITAVVGVEEFLIKLTELFPVIDWLITDTLLYTTCKFTVPVTLKSNTTEPCAFPKLTV